MNDQTILETAKILTSNKLPDRFLDTKIYEPTSPEERRFGNCYILTEITTPWFPTAKITKLIRESFLEEYYRGDSVGSEAKRFESGLKVVNKKLSDLAGSGATEWIGNLNAIIATISNRRLCLSHTGTAEGYLFRQNKISHITEGTDIPKNPLPIQTFSALIAGDLEKGDRLVLSNSEMYNFVSIDTLRSAVAQLSPNSAVDEVADILFKEKAKKINAIFVYIKSDDLIDAKTTSALPDTIFLDGDNDTFPSPLKGRFGFNAQGVASGSKKMITGLGFGVLSAGKTIGNLFKKKEVTPLPADTKLETTSDNKNLAYITKSVDLNLSHDTRKRTKSGNAISSAFQTVISWIGSLNKKWLFGVIGFIIIALIVGGVVLRNRIGQKTSSDLTTIVSAAQEKINSADTQIALHNDSVARTQLAEAKSMLEGIKDKPKSPVEVVLLLDKINEMLDKVNKITKVDSPKELAALGSLVQNLDANELIYLNGVLYAINKNGKELLGVIPDKGDKQIQTELASSAGNLTHLTFYDNDRIIVMETATAQIFEYSIKNNKLEEKTNANNQRYPEASALGSYLSTLYFLDNDNNQILKYSKTTAGYDKGRSAFKTGAFNLKDVSSLAIDGNIYLLHEDGTIEKTLKGEKAGDFKVSNIPDPDPTFDQPDKIFTTLDSTSLYILENKKQRIVELSKNGEYLRQFKFGGNVGNISDFTVNEKAKKLYLLAKNSVFEIDL